MVSVLQGQCDPLLDPVIKFPFVCDNFQNHAFRTIENDHNVIVCASTSSGKTCVAKYGLIYTIKKYKKRVIYVSPTKSLANEKYYEFNKDLNQTIKDILVTDQQCIGLLTGDIKRDVEAMCLIVTAEILQNSLYKLKNKVESKLSQDFVDSIGCVILDEFHFMNDVERGHVWEEIIILLDKSVQIIILSATIGNQLEIANWIYSCNNKPIALIPTNKRIVPLKHYIFVNNNLYQILDENFSDVEYDKALHQCKQTKLTQQSLIVNLIKYLREHNLFQTICFTFSRNNCEKFANMINETLLDHETQSEVEKIFDRYINIHLKDHKYIPQINTLKTLLLKGIAFHHAGVIPILKEIVEILFKAGHIKVLFATETFAVGVNTPTRTTVLIELTKPATNNKRRYIYTSEYKQMSGRAGRRGLDVCGTSIILPNPFTRDFLPDKTELRNILLGHIPNIKSNFSMTYHCYLKILQSANINNVNEFFQKSLLGLEHRTHMKTIQDQINELTKEFDSYNILISYCIHDLSVVHDLIKYNNKFNNIIKPNKQELKEIKKLNNIISHNKELSKMFDIFVKIEDVKNQINNLTLQLDNYINYTETQCNIIKQILTKWNYINEAILTKGIIAIQINECNPIIITEIITNNFLDDMTSEEIIGYLSIFCEPIKKGEKDSSNDFTGTPLIKERINKLFKLILTMREDEPENSNFCNWDINLDYIDIAYNWAKSMPLYDMIKLLEDLEEHIGNFIKNMLRIYNILQGITQIYKMIHNVKIIGTLEEAQKLIIRDIVSINSIYLTE